MDSNQYLKDNDVKKLSGFVKQLGGKWFLEKGHKNVLQINLFHDRDKLNYITKDNVYQSNIISNRYDKSEKKSQIIIL